MEKSKALAEIDRWIAASQAEVGREQFAGNVVKEERAKGELFTARRARGLVERIETV